MNRLSPPRQSSHLRPLERAHSSPRPEVALRGALSLALVTALLVTALLGCHGARPSAPPDAELDPAAYAKHSEELASRLGLAPGLRHRHRTRTLTAADDHVLAVVEKGAAKRIEGLAFDSPAAFAALGHVPREAATYVLVNDDEKVVRPVGWLDEQTGDVIELNTGYRLRILDAPGLGTRDGAGGEAFFVYGFAWYPRWNRILPEPTAQQLDAFYSKGVAHVKAHLTQFQEVARPSRAGGDLMLVTWDEALLDRMADWGSKLPAAPYAHLPDSGKVDIRKERFEQAVAGGRVVLDQAALVAYRAAERTKRRFGTVPSEAEIREVLLAPFRHPERFSLADQAVILDAVYDGSEALRLVIDPDVGGGFFVPDNGHKEVHVAYSEVDLNFRYNGLIFAKLAHEAHHVIEFRQRPFLAERCWHHRDDMIETLKYLNEFMWWVEHYPGDAPHWDWAPINAGIVLASLLEGYFPNSRC